MNEAKTTKGGAQDKILRILLALLLAFSGAFATLLQALPNKAYAATATLVDTGTNFDFYQTDSKTGNHWADSRFQINGEDAYCIEITDTAVAGSSYTSRSMSETMALKIGLYKKYLSSEHSGWSAMKRAGYLQYMIWCEYSSSYMTSYVTPDNDDFYDVYDAAKEYYKDHKDEYEAQGTEWVSDDSQNVCVAPTLTKKGKISLGKTSGITAISNGNDCYSLKGAVYTVYTDSACTNKYGTITTDEKGKGTLEKVSSGTYYVKETKASPGYSLDTTKYKVEVTAGNTAEVGGSKGSVEIPKSDPVPMLVMKVDATTGKGSPEGAGTLAGAEFTVKYYAGYFSTASAAESSDKLKKTWVFKTDADGFADYADAYKVSGPALYHMSNGQPTIPLGTVVIQETKAPVGYKLDDGNGGTPKKFCIQITDDGAQGESVYTYNSPKSADTIKRGDYRLVKEVPIEVEADSGIVQESKRVLLPGIKFQLKNSSANSIVSPETGAEVQPGGVVCTITTDENGFASTKSGAAVNGWSIPSGWTGALAFGTYTVHEVIPASVAATFKAQYGHDIIAVPDWKLTISEEKQYDGAVLVNNHIPQTPLKVIKVDAETGKQIPLQCSFKLRDSKNKIVTYESHYPETSIMDTWTTNDKGEVMLPMLLEEGSYQLIEVQAPEGYVKALEGKSFNVGAVYNNWDNPIIVKFQDMPQKATISIIKHDSTNGYPVGESTYIVKAATDIVTPEGTVRAKAGQIVATLVTNGEGHAQSQELYLGTYTVYEAKAKDGFSLDTVEKTVTLEYKGQDVSVYDEDLEVVDEPTELKLKKVDAIDAEKPVEGAKFHLWSDDGAVDDELITDAEGMIDVSYLKHGKYHLQETEAPEGYVIYDVDEDGNAKVYDLTVNDQGMFEFDDGSMKAVYELTVENMPKTMHTTATDGASGAHEGQARGELAIVDMVEYTGTIPGDEYKVTGKLMDKETGEPARDAEGNEIVAEATFTAEAFTGSIEITFVFDGVELAGKSLVAFETMEYEDTEYMVHADIEDVDQTVNIVDIHTQAKNPETEDQTGIVNEHLKLVDVVEYIGLTPGNTYTMCGHIVDSETGDELLDAEGVAYTCVKEFTPEETDGSIEMEFEIDATGLEGKTTVFAETLVDVEGNIIAVHEDLEDEGQSIFFPDVHTNAANTAGGKNVIAGEAAEVIDTVTYENLIPGKTYILTGTLMDKSTGEPMKDAKDEPITATTTFVPEEPNGTAEVKFAFDATKLATKTAVVFESLSKDGIEVAVHADINDEAQTVFFPEIHTNALDGADGDKNVVAAAKAEVIDTVSYKNLIVGKDYTVTGTLMDKETGKPMKDAKGNTITASATFAPGKPDGEVEVKFAFDATGLGNKTGVVFESLVSDGLEVAVHADIDDEAQTVNFTEPEPEPEGKGYPKTGAMATVVAAGAGGLALLAYGLAGGGSALLKRRKPSEVESLDEE